MRHALAAFVALLGLGAAASSQAQFEHEPTTGVPDVLAGPATIRGLIVHATRPDAVKNIEIVLYALSLTGDTGLRSATSDASGAFAFEKISNHPGTVYLVGARYGAIPFGTKFSFEANEVVRSIELKISDPSDSAADTAQVRIGESALRFDRSCEMIRVRETFEIRNPTAQVILIPEALRNEREPIFELTLPEGAHGFSSVLGDMLSGLIFADGTVRFWGPVQTGTQSIEFSYALPDTGSPLRFRRSLDRGAESVAVIAPRSWPAPTGAPGSDAPIQVGEFTRYVIARDAAPGSVLRFDLEAPRRGLAKSASSLLESQIWIELDDAALTVNEHHLFETSENAAQLATGEPLLCISLPENAEGLRFSNQTLALGISADPSGVLAVHGPLPPAGPNGNSISFRYQLSVDSEPIHFDRTFVQRVPLLSVLIADTHLLTETNRLHRRRSTQSGDRTYIHLEAFEVAAGETVPLALTRLTVAAPLPPWAFGGLLTLATTFALFFLIAPLQTRARDDNGDFETAALSTAATRAAEERENVYATIDDLDHDLETAKVTAEDHAIMRADLLARAVALVQAERAAQSATAREEREAHEDPPAKECMDCAAALAHDARFCSHCGAKVQAKAERDCSGCGATLARGSQFCSQCGTQVKAKAERASESR